MSPDQLFLCALACVAMVVLLAVVLIGERHRGPRTSIVECPVCFETVDLELLAPGPSGRKLPILHRVHTSAEIGDYTARLLDELSVGEPR